MSGIAYRRAGEMRIAAVTPVIEIASVIAGLTARRGSWGRMPSGDGGLVEPERQITSALQPCIVLSPVPNGYCAPKRFGQSGLGLKSMADRRGCWALSTGNYPACIRRAAQTRTDADLDALIDDHLADISRGAGG